MSSRSKATMMDLRARPYAESPAPEHCRVDLCTADAEWMRRLYPDSPQPVFSSLSLIHGSNARGAQRLRPGFSFTPSMDLVWALGFPYVAFIVDGVPVPDTFAKTLELYRAEKVVPDNWSDIQVEHSRIYTRRAAIARLFELTPYPEDASEDEKEELARSVFELDEDDAEYYTEERNMTDVRLRMALIRSAVNYGGAFSEDIPLLSAFLGPDRVAEMIIQLLEEEVSGIRISSLVFGFHIVSLALTAEKYEELSERARSWWERNRDAKEADHLRWIFDTSAMASSKLTSEGSVGFYRATVLNFPGGPLNEDAQTNTRIDSNDPFIADPHAVLKKITATWNVWADIDEHFLGAHSSIVSPEVLPNMLELYGTKETKEKASAWFRARQEWATPHLERLVGADNAKLAKLAARVLKNLSIATKKFRSSEEKQ